MKKFLIASTFSAFATFTVIAQPALAQAADEPTSRPAPRASDRSSDRPSSRPTSRPTRGEGQMLDRLSHVLSELNLDKETSDRVNKIVDDAKAESREMVQELRDMEPKLRRARLMQFGDDLREKLNGALNDEQRTALRDKLGSGMQQAGEMPGRFFEQVQSHLDDLKLDDEQKAKVTSLFDDAKKQLDDLRAGAQAGDREARGKVGDIMRDTNEALDKILSPDQLEKLREYLPSRGQGPRGDGPARGDGAPSEKMTPRGDGAPPDEAPPRGDRPQRRFQRRDRGPAATQPGKGETVMRGGDVEMMMASGAARKATASSDQPAAEVVPADLSSGLPAVGQPAPDFELRKLDGPVVKLSAQQGKVVLLVFGSYSSATFRDKAADLDTLRKDLGTRASVLMIYTREAHPSDGWKIDRNEDADVNVPQARDMPERELAATKLKNTAKLNTPIVLDVMDDTTAKAYGAYPNGAVLIGRDGNIAYRQKWFDTVTLKRHIDDAIAGKTATTQPSEL